MCDADEMAPMLSRIPPLPNYNELVVEGLQGGLVSIYFRKPDRIQEKADISFHELNYQLQDFWGDIGVFSIVERKMPGSNCNIPGRIGTSKPWGQLMIDIGNAKNDTKTRENISQRVLSYLNNADEQQQYEYPKDFVFGEDVTVNPMHTICAIMCDDEVKHMLVTKIACQEQHIDCIKKAITAVLSGRNDHNDTFTGEDAEWEQLILMVASRTIYYTLQCNHHYIFIKNVEKKGLYIALHKKMALFLYTEWRHEFGEKFYAKDFKKYFANLFDYTDNWLHHEVRRVVPLDNTNTSLVEFDKEDLRG